MQKTISPISFKKSGKNYFVNRQSDDEIETSKDDTKPSPFDYLNAAYKKEGFDTLINNRFFETSYNKFLVCRALSQFPETIGYAEVMNELSDIPNELHFRILYTLLPRKKQYGRWAKADVVTERIKTISEFYQVNLRKAEEYSRLLSESQWNYIKESMEKEK
jgi:hypothetical protein